MAEPDLPSSQALRDPSTEPETEAPTKLDLSALPPIFVSAAQFETDDLHELEEALADVGAVLTYDVAEARVIISKVEKPKAVMFNLRGKGLWTEEVKAVKDEGDETGTEDAVVVNGDSSTEDEKPAKKKRRWLEKTERMNEAGLGKSQAEAIVIGDESTESEAEVAARGQDERTVEKESKKAGPVKARAVCTPSPVRLKEEDLIKVVKVGWFEGSLKGGKVLPLEDYLILQCRRIDRPTADCTPPSKHILAQATRPITALSQTLRAASPNPRKDITHILVRAKEDAETNPVKSFDRFGKRRFGQHPTTNGASWAGGGSTSTKYAHLLQQTTTEHDQGYSSDLPEMPDWVKQGLKYACQRSTPANSPNEPFIDLLKKIKLARVLTNDEIGVRAYSTSIASLAAYPYKLVNPREIMALPGCDAKIANLFVEYSNSPSHTIKAVEDLEADPDLTVLRLFYEIWGVGATTAREFYYDRGWKDLDDIVEFGWSTLSRVQQIGVKYYDEFLDPIPRKEVEDIAAVVHRHAVKVRDEGIQSLIVGGYRRGKEKCGDVDMIVSHPDESQTLNIINDIVASLEDEGWITHTLLLSLHSTHRGQQTLPFKASHNNPVHLGGGGGFDTLDKALVVWQDPHRATETEDLAANPKAKNPNIHRRVDIIIAPWRTVGCAVAGWSGGTTFQRDLRRYCKNVKGLKFDSSGVRDRGNGEVVDVEGWREYKGSIGEGKAGDMVQAERRVFEGLGLAFREPWERCTG